MKRFLTLCCLVAVAVVSSSDTASAQTQGGAYGFLPFGFYQPYGATYQTSLRTPPYFALSPPVYYGARHARPYGLSPFASPPLVASGDNYQSRLRMQFSQPQVPTPGPQLRSAPVCNPCFGEASSAQVKVASLAPKHGEVRENPFVSSTELVAKR